ncbi:MAG: hypothetical protein JWL62_1964, partial [Hyphomicrobiales bacterium]|nr:hypothetical protein [Hyphomicrobiales bacterium]
RTGRQSRGTTVQFSRAEFGVNHEHAKRASKTLTQGDGEGKPRYSATRDYDILHVRSPTP